MAFGGEESQAGWRAGNSELDPALLLGVRLIGDDLEAEGFGEELQGNILIADGDADELDAANHAGLLWKTFQKITWGLWGLQSGSDCYRNRWHSYDFPGRLRFRCVAAGSGGA